MTTLDVLPDGSAIHDVTDEGVQAWKDYRDGYALRQLREALPDGAWFGLDVDPTTPTDEYLALQAAIGTPHTVFSIELYSDPSDLRAEFHGTTIAEAADKCREFLP